MNWILIVAGVILLLGLAWGYYKGFLMMVFSVVSWLIALVIVSCASPIITNMIIDKTGIDEQIEERTVLQLEKLAEDRVAERKDFGKKGNTDVSAELSSLGIELPGILMDQLTDTEGMTDKVIRKMGIYQIIAHNTSRMVIQGATFLLVLIITKIILLIVGYALDLISKIAGIREVNKLAGAAIGALEGLLILWIWFAVIAFWSTTEWGVSMIAKIYETDLLPIIYENNLIVMLAGIFL